MSETIYLEVAGRTMDVLVASPAGTGPFPGVLLMFHRGGMDDCTAHYVKELPKAGYLTIVPNFYHHCPKDVPVHDCKQFLKDTEVTTEIAASADYALGRSDLDRSRFFIMGHCMGGRLTFLGAATKPGFTAGVAYYGGGMMTHSGEGMPTPFDLIGNIKCPIYGFFGGLDKTLHPTMRINSRPLSSATTFRTSSIDIQTPTMASRTRHARIPARRKKSRLPTKPGQRC